MKIRHMVLFKHNIGPYINSLVCQVPKAHSPLCYEKKRKHETTSTPLVYKIVCDIAHGW